MRCPARWGRHAAAKVAGIVACLLQVACASTGTVGLLTRSLANPSDLLTQVHTYHVIGPVEGTACRYFALAVAPWGDSSTPTAVERALSGSGGDALLNVTVTSSLYGFIPYWNILSFTCTTVAGTAIRIDSLPPPQPSPPEAAGSSPP